MKAYFQDKVVVITGGSSGIGLALAEQLAGLGARVAILARKRAKLEIALEKIRAAAESAGMPRSDSRGDYVRAFPLDVGEYRVARKVMAAIEKELGPIDMLINCAGRSRPGYADALPLRVYRDVMDANFMGTVHAVRAALPGMLGRGRGHIVNVGSVAGFIGVFGHTAYGASKFAVHGYTEALRSELRPRGIHVSLLCPPDTDTPMLRGERKHVPPELEKIAASAGMISAEQVAERTLKAMARNRFMILPNFESRYVHFMYRHFPGLVRWIMDRQIAAAARKHGRAKAQTAKASAKSLDAKSGDAKA